VGQEVLRQRIASLKSTLEDTTVRRTELVESVKQKGRQAEKFERDYDAKLQEVRRCDDLDVMARPRLVNQARALKTGQKDAEREMAVAKEMLAQCETDEKQLKKDIGLYEKASESAQPTEPAKKKLKPDPKPAPEPKPKPKPKSKPKKPNPRPSLSPTGQPATKKSKPTPKKKKTSEPKDKAKPEPKPEPTPGGGGGGKLDNKFAAKEFMLGDQAQAIHGMKALLAITDKQVSKWMNSTKAPLAAIKKEFRENGTQDDKANLKHILAGTKWSTPTDDGAMKKPADFLEHEISKTAGLEEHHIVALRLYTSSSYQSLNDSCRQKKRSTVNGSNPFAATLWYIRDGISKIRIAQVGTGQLDLYRGLRDVDIQNFLNSADGGTELGCMSFSSDKEVALGFAAGADTAAILLHVETDAHSRGACVKFLSCFGHEEEYMYPPLTFLKAKNQVPQLKEFHGKKIQIVQVEARGNWA
jgi:hypothetical protein